MENETRKIILKLKEMNLNGFTPLQSDKQKAFLSISNGAERVRTFSGVGNSIDTAVVTAMNNAIKYIKEKKYTPIWIMLSFVTEEQVYGKEDYYKLLTGSRRGFFRKGLALEPFYQFAFLEQEMNASHLYQYINRNNIFLHDGNISNFLRRMGKVSKQVMFRSDGVKEFIVFDTKSCFYGDGKYLEIEASGPFKGIRHIDLTKSEIVYDLICKTADYLLSTQQEDGKFIYGYLPCFHATLTSYNIVRHALAVFAFMDCYRITQDDRYRTAALQSLHFMLNNYVHMSDEAAYLVEYGEEAEIKLGGSALLILSISSCLEFLEDKAHYMDLLRKAGNGILKLQKENGQYMHVLNYPDMTVKDEFRTLYYTGEACYALMRLYGLDRDPKWINSVKLAFVYAEAEKYYNSFDHWLAYAVNELTIYESEDFYYEFGLKNAFLNIDFVTERETAWTTMLEMLMATSSILESIEKKGKGYLLEGYDINKFEAAATSRVQIQTASLFWPEMAMFFKCPEKILYGSYVRHHLFRVRNDDEAHHLMGFCSYYRYLSEKSDSV